jgi:hypothetical protein
MLNTWKIIANLIAKLFTAVPKDMEILNKTEII